MEIKSGETYDLDGSNYKYRCVATNSDYQSIGWIGTKPAICMQDKVYIWVDGIENKPMIYNIKKHPRRIWVNEQNGVIVDPIFTNFNSAFDASITAPEGTKTIEFVEVK